MTTTLCEATFGKEHFGSATVKAVKSDTGLFAVVVREFCGVECPPKIRNFWHDEIGAMAGYLIACAHYRKAYA